MRIGGAHLTYCTNIHPGESWDQVFANLEKYTVAVKQRVCPDEPFGVGLRLSMRAARELAPQIGAFRGWLDEHGLYVFTINGFPYGNFHGTRVKEAVYRPDWLEDERVAYTMLLADLLAALLPTGELGSISTVPGCFHARGNDSRIIADNLQRCVDRCRRDNIFLALEPEPACLLETVDQAIAFILEHRLIGAAICLDACHEAVEFASPRRIREVVVAKTQLSCGLRVAPVDDAARAELARFADPVYLHQTVARRGGELARYVDLPDALADPTPADEWRIHFHVPIFRESLGSFASTQPFLAELLAHNNSIHYEVETYTWDVLPAEFRDEPIEDAIARELMWVRQHLA